MTSDDAASLTPPAVSVEEPESDAAGRLVLRAVAVVLVLALVAAVMGWSRLGAETYLALWAAVTGGVWFLFDKAEQALTPSARAEAIRAVRGVSLGEAVERVPQAFALLFDRVFGERHLSWQCFYRSCFTSLVAVSLALVLWLVTRPEARFLALDPAFVKATLWMIFFTGLLNFVPDYLSLLETRFLLKRMKGRGGFGAILLLDLLFTATISFVLIRASLGIVYGSGIVMYAGSDPTDLMVDVADVQLGSIPTQLADLATFDESYGDIAISMTAVGADTYGEIPIPLGVFFYSAFVTSVWLWLFALSSVLIRGALALGGRVAPFVRLLDFDQAPFRAAGFMTALLVSLLFFAGLPFVL